MKGFCSTCCAPRKVNSRCRPCRNAFERKRYRENREANLARAIRWQKANPEKRRAIWRKYARRIRLEAKTLLGSLPCLECGMNHTPERRTAILRRMLPAAVHEIREAWSCIWGPPSEKSSAGEKRLGRDLRAVGAVRVQGSWFLEAEAGRAA